jgi:nitrite reductase/ring-hydroxylating ferredoxin subunit
MPCNRSRRQFLQEGGCFAVTLASLGLGSGQAFALPVGTVSGAGAGPERRYPIPAADGVDIDRKASVIVVRFSGHAFAFALSCPHQNAAVKWVAKNHRFQCTKHDSEYKPDGVYVTGHATRNLDRFPVRRDGDELVVDLSRVYHSDADAADWAAAMVAV